MRGVDMRGKAVEWDCGILFVFVRTRIEPARIYVSLRFIMSILSTYHDVVCLCVEDWECKRAGSALSVVC